MQRDVRVAQSDYYASRERCVHKSLNLVAVQEEISCDNSQKEKIEESIDSTDNFFAWFPVLHTIFRAGAEVKTRDECSVQVYWGIHPVLHCVKHICDLNASVSPAG